MTRLFLQNPDELKNLLKGKRFVFGVGDASEKPEQAAVPEEEKFENRKQQARGELDSIYGSGKYDTYNFRKLPQEFKDHMRNNFGQWIDSNIAKYDKDKNSGINAAEYDDFKSKLNEKVTEILDRLIEAKEQKKKQAIENRETAEQAKETQKRLEGINTDKLNEANLENEDGCYTELLSYQKDFEKEASGFAALAGVFSGAKEKADNANKSHYTGATAFGEMLVSWVSDIPEVKSANQAKEQAIADFRSKLGEMKTRQKERQGRGAKLNGAPEKIRGKVAAQYDEAKNKTREELDLAKKADEENRREKARLAEEIKLNEERKKAAQKEYDMLVIRLRQAEQRKQEVEKRTGEMREAATGFDRTAEAAKAERKRTGGKSIPAQPGKMSVEELASQASKSASKAKEVAVDLETGLKAAEQAVGGMSGSAMVIQRRLADLNSSHKLMTSDLSKREKTGELLSEAATGLNDRLEKLSTEEKQRIEQVDALDSAIAETVIQIDTSNFELVKKGENYLKMLTSLDISGPGLLDTAGSMIMGIPGVETAYNWSGDKLSAGWQWAKSAPVLGVGIEIVGYMGEGWVKAWDGIGSGLSWVGDKLHIQDAWDWMGDASKHLSIGNPTGNPLADAILDTFTGGGLGTIIEVFAGVTAGAAGLIQGVGMMVQHPFETIKGLGGLLNHPTKIIYALIQKDKWGDESASKIIGRALFDVITTMTGAGATATSIKTAITAMKLGGMGAGKAILLALKTFPKVLIQDIGKLVVGAVKMPVTLIKGSADLFKWLARGGKKLEPIQGAGSAAAKLTAREQEALRGLESARNNPEEFVKWLQKYPDQVDFAYKIVKEEKKAARAAAKTEKAAAKETARNPSAGAKAEEKTPEKAAAAEPPPPAEIGYGLKVSNDERTAPRIPKTKDVAEKLSANELAFQERMAAEKAAEAERLRGRLRREAEGAEKQKAVVAELSASDWALLDRRPDYRSKPLTPERLSQMRRLEEQMGKSEVFAAVNKKFKEAMEELQKRHSEERAGLDPKSQDYSKRQKDLARRHREEAARVDTHSLLEALPEDELDMLRRNFENLDETIMSRVLQQEYMMVLDIDNRPVRVYLGNPINNGAFGMVHDSAYVVGREKTIHTGAAIKRPRDMASIKADEDFKKYTTAQMNEHLVSMEVSVANEVRTFQSVRDFPNGDGLLRPRVISNNPANPFVIYDKIDSGSETGVRLKDRISAGDRSEDILGFAAEAMDGELNLARNGWFHLDIKPENIFVGQDATGALHGVLGDLSLNNVDDIATIRFMEGTLPSGSKQVAVLKVDKTNYTRSVLIGVTPDFFSFDHVNKSFEWVKANPGKAVPEAIMALPGNNAFAVTLERTFNEMIRDSNQNITGMRFADDRLPITNRQQIRGEIDSLIKRLKDPESGIDITTRQAEFRRLQKMMAEARERDGQIASTALRPTG